jgi:XTP/dITP diphosphohydrolase
MILIATNNHGKFNEISDLLYSIGISAISPFDFNLTEPEETACTFAENALIKAKYYAKTTNNIALADDSGLCILPLNNKPGVQSARFARDEVGNKNFSLAFKKIEQQLISVGFDLEKKFAPAYFVCNLCLYNPFNDQAQNFEGRLNGKIVAPKGKNGFGYDPIFVRDGDNLTFGQISAEQKHQISHRYLAFLQLKEFLKNNTNHILTN